MTSFKTAQLISNIAEIHKVLFVVNKKDLDYQTMKEYDRFQKGAASGSKNIKELKNRLINTSKERKIIITTIQKLSRFITKANKDNEIFDNHIAMIFDECHRSQFEAMQKLIKNPLKNSIFLALAAHPFMQKMHKDLRLLKVSLESVCTATLLSTLYGIIMSCLFA